jgi:hypothetical protein
MGIDRGLNTALDNLVELEKQYDIGTAEGAELDEWGSWFNVYRDLNELDNEYRGRILSTVSTQKNTIPAIRQAVATYLSAFYGVRVEPSDVKIYEPYTNIIKYSDINSAYSTDDKYPDALFYRSNVISIIIPYGATEGLKKLLQTIRPAGLKVVFDVQLVPERPDPSNPGSQPVDATHMVPNENVVISRYLKAVGTDGFFHPFMNGITKYSGTRNLYSWIELQLGGALVQLLSPVQIITQSEFEYMLQVSYPDPVIYPLNELDFYTKAMIGDTHVTVGKELFIYSKSQGTAVVPNEHLELEKWTMLHWPDVKIYSGNRELEVSGGLPVLGDITPVYDQYMSVSPYYNDDEFNIKLSSAYTIAEIGDVPLNRATWINGPIDIEITQN